MLHAIVFSHRRQYQLHACLESLYFYVQPNKITVIYGQDNDYELVMKAFPQIEFVQDNPFDATLHTTVATSDFPMVMFCVDDLFFVRRVNKLSILSKLQEFDRLLGVGLRLHDFLRGAPAKRMWDWTKFKSYQYGTGWGYPFDVSGTIYRSEAVAALMVFCKQNHNPIDGPNHFEMIGYSCPYLEEWPFLMRKKKCSVIGSHVNGVQSYIKPTREVRDIYPTEMLDELYRQGHRFDWLSIQDPIHSVFDTKSIYWKL